MSANARVMNNAELVIELGRTRDLLAEAEAKITALRESQAATWVAIDKITAAQLRVQLLMKRLMETRHE